MKYRKKPILIDALLFDGKNAIEVLSFMEISHDVDYRNPFDRDSYCDYITKLNETGIEITTLEGIMKAQIGDYIIKGVQGEFYPCKPDIFEQTYEIVEK